MLDTEKKRQVNFLKWQVEFLEQFFSKPPYVLHENLSFILTLIREEIDHLQPNNDEEE